MTPRDLIAAFEALAEAPDGVARLRELVLQLAVRGKLVSQDQEDELASVLVERVRRDAATAPKSRVQVAFEDDVPFDAPGSWGWVYLGEAMNLVNGKAFKSGEWASEGLPIIRIQNLNDVAASFNYCSFTVKEQYYVADGDLLLSWSGTPGTSFGAFVWTRGKAVLNQHIFRCEPRGNAYDISFLRLAINCRLAEMIDRAHGGVGLRHVTRGKLDGLWLVLPPFLEQKRIVARVDELMGLLDKLEAARNAREATRTALRDAALAALQNADTPEEVEIAWNRIAERMHDLFTDPADIPPLRQTILQLAVRGRLVPQDPNDEPASVLLERIAAEKTRLVAEKKIKKPNALPPIEVDDVPFNLPKAWSWSRVNDLTTALSYGTSSKSLPEGSVPVLRMGNLQGGEIDWSNLKFTSDPEEIEKYGLSPGSVLFNRTNSPELVGKTSIYRGERPAAFAGYLIHVAVVGGVEAEFVNVVLNSPMARDWCWQIKSDGISQSNISASKLATLAVPLPPAAEQARIVVRVAEMVGLLDRLKERLASATKTHAAFAAAAVHDLDT